MPKDRIIQLQPPLGGLNKAWAYQSQPPFTTPKCLNVRPRDVMRRRHRIGSRPGLAKAYPQELGSGNPIRMLSQVTVAASDGFTFWEDLFIGDELASVWTEAAWLTETPDILPDNLEDLVYEEESGIVRSAISDLDTTQAYTVSIFISPWWGEDADGVPQDEYHGEFDIFLRMNNTTPNAETDGVKTRLFLCPILTSGSLIIDNDYLIIANSGSTFTTAGAANNNVGTEFTATGTSVTWGTGKLVSLSEAGTGDYSGFLETYDGSTLQNRYVFTTGDSGSAKFGLFSATVNGGTITCNWLGTQILSQNVSGDLDAGAQHRIGCGFRATALASNTNSDGLCIIEAFRVKYFSDSGQTPYRTILIAASNGILYYEDTNGNMTATSSTVTLASDRNLMAVEMLQKLYIADYSEAKAAAADGTILNNVLTSPTYTDWPAVTPAIDIAEDVVVLSAHSVDGGDNTFKMVTLSVGGLGNILLDGTAEDGTCTFSIERAPKIYDPIADTLEIWHTTTGQVPTGCPIIFEYRSRVGFAGKPVHVWYMPRVENPLDWDYSETDENAAVAGANADAGNIGKPITGVIVHGDDYIVMGSDHDLYVLRGDPASGGRIDRISDIKGIVSREAITRGPNGETFFLSHNGLYALNRDPGFTPLNISGDKLPDEFRKLDPINTEINVDYDPIDRGIHIFITSKTSNAKSNHWWVEWDEGISFWPVQLLNAHEPYSVQYYDANSVQDRAVIVGCRDGYLRRHRDQQNSDDGTAFDSYVFYGPLRLGNGYQEGILQELIGKMADYMYPVTWGVVSAAEEERLGTRTLSHTGTWSMGLNPANAPRISGQSMVLKVSGISGRWSIEDILVRIKPGGKSRK